MRTIDKPGVHPIRHLLLDPEVTEIMINGPSQLFVEMGGKMIQDTEAWRAQPWYAHYDRRAQGGKTILFHVRPGSYALVFPVGFTLL